MRKFLLLSGFLLFSFVVSAQRDTVLFETFDTGIPTTGWKIKGGWNDTDLVAISAPYSLHNQGVLPNTVDTLELPSFSSINFPFVYFSYYQIAKLLLPNNVELQTSVDGGVTWDSVNTSLYYRGPATGFPPNSKTIFSETSYIGANNLWVAGSDVVPDNSWWVQESYDLSDVFQDPGGGGGYPDCRIRFIVRYILNHNPFRSGFYIDNILLERSSCELLPPTLSLDYSPYTPPNGCAPNPIGPVVEEPSNAYAVGLLASDDTSGIDYVLLHWRNSSNGIWNIDTMDATSYTPAGPNGPREYRDTIFNVLLGDSVDWYITAVDKSNPCQNETRVPDPLVQSFYTFFPQPGYPLKCGNPDCGALPTTISSFPWVEGFEAPRFGPGTGPTDYRGTFPEGNTIGNYWTLLQNPSNSGYAWSVINQPTYTNLTGPTADHSPNGVNYIYTESTEGNTNDLALIITPCIDLTNVTNTCMALEFWYHMYGDHIGRLEVDVDDGVNTQSFTNLVTFNGGQQDSTNQEWKRGIIDLSPYIGTFIRIRMRGRKAAGGDRGDIALDDLKIFTPPAKEFELLSLESPKRGGCGYFSEPVTVKYRHAGCDTTNYIPFAYRYNSGAIVRDTLFGTFALGDTGTFTFSTLANITLPGTYVFEVWTDESTDGDPSNDTLVSGDIINQPAYNNFPYLEYFEDGTVGTTNFNFPNPVFTQTSGQDPDFVWMVGRELTPTRGTGPWRGYYFDANSKYLYTSSTNPAGGGTASGNVSTYFQSIACLDFSGMTNPYITFAYHMFGPSIQSIELEYSTGVNGENWLPLPGSLLLASSQTSFFPRETSDWRIYKRKLTLLAGTSAKLRIKVNRTGAALTSDFAMDNLFIYDQGAQDAGVSRIAVPNMQVPAAGNLSPQILVENYGTSALTNVPLVIEIKALCGSQAGQVQTFTQTIPNIAAESNTLYTFDYQSVNPNLQFPVGEFEIKAYTNIAGDPNNFNDTIKKNSIHIGTHKITFMDDFDNCGFSESGFGPTGSGFRQWELGVPGAPMLSAFSSPNAWTVNKEGGVVTGSAEILRIPDLFGFDNIVAPEIRFYQYRAFTNSSAGTIEYSVAGGWAPLLGQDPTLGVNWFGGPNAELSNDIIGGANGAPAWIGDGTWEFSMYPLDFLNFSSTTLAARFRYVSNLATAPGPTPGGWSIDNFALVIPPQYSTSPVRVRTINPLPVPGNDQGLSITVQNTGKQLMTSYVQKVIFDPFTNALDLGEDSVVLPTNVFKVEGSTWTTTYRFVIPASRATAGLHDICVITTWPNDSVDDVPADDTLCTQIRILDEFVFDNGTNKEYCNDFDGNLGSFEFFGLNNYTYDINPNTFSWERGIPAQGPAGAFSAPNVWMTDLDSNYKSRDSSALFTPVFLVEADTNYEVTFMHWYETERATDGGSFLVSDDGGLSWQTIGWQGEEDWFNTRFINALDIIKPGWSDTSGGWDSARYVFSFQQGDQVIFKFRFESDWDIEYSGWAIDDFCIRKTNDPSTYVIGVDEYNPAESVFFGELAPNPTMGSSVIPFVIPENKEVRVLVTNMMGQAIEQRQEDFQRGNNVLRFETENWRSGVYNITIQLDEAVVNRKLVVQ